MQETREVYTERDSGSGTGMVVGIILALLVAAVVAFLFFGSAFRGGTTTPAQPNNPTNVQINPPAAPPKVDINVNPPAQQAPAPAQPAPAKP